MPPALPGLVFGAALWCFVNAILAGLFGVPDFLTSTLLITGLFLVFAYYHLKSHQQKPS